MTASFPHHCAEARALLTPAELALVGLVADLFVIVDADMLEREIRIHGDNDTGQVYDRLAGIRDEYPDLFRILDRGGSAHGAGRLLARIDDARQVASPSGGE